jgi:hypothetical protein
MLYFCKTTISNHGHELFFDKFFKEISSLPLKPGIETISLSLFSPGQADQFHFQ